MKKDQFCIYRLKFTCKSVIISYSQSKSDLFITNQLPRNDYSVVLENTYFMKMKKLNSSYYHQPNKRDQNRMQVKHHP